MTALPEFCCYSCRAWKKAGATRHAAPSGRLVCARCQELAERNVNGITTDRGHLSPDALAKGRSNNKRKYSRFKENYR